MLTVPAAPPSSLRSPIEGVADGEWRALVAALTVQRIGAVSESGGLGCFDLRPRRLAELGIMDRASLRCERALSGRHRQDGDFVPPTTRERFLSSLEDQYATLLASLRDHLAAIERGELSLPDGVSRSGALAILHRGGKRALAAYPDLLSDTRALFERAQGCFR